MRTCAKPRARRSSRCPIGYVSQRVAVGRLDAKPNEAAASWLVAKGSTRKPAAHDALIADGSLIAALARIFVLGKRKCPRQAAPFEIAAIFCSVELLADASMIHVYHWRATEFRQTAQHHAQAFGVVPRVHG